MFWDGAEGRLCREHGRRRAATKTSSMPWRLASDLAQRIRPARTIAVISVPGCRRCGAGDHAPRSRRACVSPGLALADHPPAAQHPDAVGDAEDLIEVVADDEDGETPLAQTEDDLLDGPGLGHAEGGSRLVHDDQLGAPGAGAGDRHDLPLATGERVRPAASIGGTRCDKALQHLRRVGEHRAFVEDVQEARPAQSARGRDRHSPRRHDCRPARDPDRPSRCRAPAPRPATRSRRACRRTRSCRRRAEARR